MNHLSQVWLIALKDLKIFARDRWALFFSLLFPFLFATLFYFLLSGIGGEDERLELHLVTRETNGISNAIINAIVTKDPEKPQPGEPLIIQEQDYETAHQKVETKQMGGFLAFPEDFTEAVTLGYGTQLEIVINPQANNVRAALTGLANSITAHINARQVRSDAMIGLTMQKELTSGNYQQLAQAIAQTVAQSFSVQTVPEDANTTSPVSLVTENVGEIEAENPSNYVIPGYLVMFVFFTAALSAEAIVRERKNHTLERLLAGSVTREAILGGIYTGTALKGIVQIIIFWLVGIFIFQMDPGESPAGVVILSVLMVLMSAAFSLMLATLVRTQQAAGALGVITSLILAPLGGCWWPLFITPRWMQFLANFTPHGWATTGFNKLMVFGAEFNSVLPNIIVLAAFTVVFATVAILRFRVASE